jgi:hypothetical protein
MSGKDRQDAKPEQSEEEPAGAEEGDGWRQQSGYGERVLDEDKGDDAAGSQSDQADTVQDHR